jgi:hypothetical protein
MKGTRIQVSHPGGAAKGVQLEGVIATGQTPKPGTVMEMTATALVGTLNTWTPYGVTAASGGNFVNADGDRKMIAILLEDFDGGYYDTAYAAGDMCRIYIPQAGEEFNMILENQSGTGDAFTLGQELMVDNGTGKLLACDSDAESQPFHIMEAASALTADAHNWVMFRGHGA